MTRFVMALAMSAGLLFSGDATAQDVSHLPKDKADVVRKLRAQNMESCFVRQLPHSQKAAAMNAELSGLDPILIGEHVVFFKEWLKSNGSKETVTREQFKNWVNQVDKLYKCYYEFTGQPPPKGEGFFFDIRKSAENTIKTGAHSHWNSNVICMKRENMNEMIKEIKGGEVGRTIMHEMGHAFTPRQCGVEAETCAHLFHSYAMEVHGFRYGERAEVGGNQFRKDKLKADIEAYQRGNLTKDVAYQPSVQSLYVLGLVDVFGWETYKKAIHSYHDPEYQPRFTYYGIGSDPKQREQSAQFRDFMGRLSHFHDIARQNGDKNIPELGKNLTGEQALRSGPDKGKLLDERFAVRIKPITDTRVATSTAPKADTERVAYTPPQTDIMLASTSEPQPKVAASKADTLSIETKRTDWLAENSETALPTTTTKTDIEVVDKRIKPSEKPSASKKTKTAMRSERTAQPEIEASKTPIVKTASRIEAERLWEEEKARVAAIRAAKASQNSETQSPQSLQP